ncbi:hypothetical protein H8D59_00360 [bacterium]|nr:hypothetical protein [bacterium]
MAKVKIPKSHYEILLLAEEIYNHHKDKGVDSDIGALGWDALKVKIDEGIAYHNEAVEHRLQAEAKFEKRNTLAAEILTIIRKTRDQLKVIHGKELHQLGDYGFTVDD